MKPAQKLPESEHSQSRADATRSSQDPARTDRSGAEHLNNPADQIPASLVDSGLDPRKDWINTPLGQLVDAQERSMVAASLPRLYNPVCVQIGSLGGRDVMASTEAVLKVVIDGAGTNRQSGPNEDKETEAVTHVAADPTALPFGERSVDLALLVHALDFSSEPHQVLREVDQILAPDGHVVIVGFNPLSLFGLRGLVGKLFRKRRHSPWSGSWLRLSRVQDWLALLGYESTAGIRSVYVPPIQSRRIAGKFEFMEKAGNRWWPRFGAVYVIVARKREIIGTPLPAWRRKRRKIGQRIAGPVTRDVTGRSQSSNRTVVPWPGTEK